MIKPPIPNLITDIIHALFEGKQEGHHVYKTLKAKANAKRTPAERFADVITSYSGNFGFLSLNILIFIIWILVNTNKIPGVLPFDPYPFQFLTMAVSLEAIILSILVLMSQNRAGKIDDLREEIHLQVNLISEREITKTIELVAKIAEKQGIDISKDKELQKMLKPIKEQDIEKRLEKEIDIS